MKSFFRPLGALTAFVFFVGSSWANEASIQDHGYGLCTADCPGNTRVSCDGSSCSAEDNVGCTYTDASGETQTKRCPVALAGAESVLVLGPESPSDLEIIDNRTIEDLAPDLVDDLVDELAIMAEARYAATGVDSSPDKYTIIGSKLASCTADCGGGKSVTCHAAPGESCSAVDGVACQTYHNAPYPNHQTHKSCNEGLAGPE